MAPPVDVTGGAFVVWKKILRLADKCEWRRFLGAVRIT
jgi:hypothetical protein